MGEAVDLFIQTSQNRCSLGSNFLTILVAKKNVKSNLKSQNWFTSPDPLSST
jgi:hypothetical protein